MSSTAKILAGFLVLAAAANVGAEERWRLKFEYEAPRKILIPPHVPPGLDFYFGQKEYYYLLYKVTNESSKRIDHMCLSIWVETDDHRRLVKPLEVDVPPGMEGMEYEVDKDRYSKTEELAARATWGSSRGTPLPPMRGAGQAYVDGFFPLVHDAVSERHGYKPKYIPSERYATGPNAALPVLADCTDVNEPLNPGESRLGCAIFAAFPVGEFRRFQDALNLLAVRAEERRAAANQQGFERMRLYAELYPEGRFIAHAKALLEQEGNRSGLDATVDKVLKEFMTGLEPVKGNNFDGYTQALDLLTRAAMLLRVYHIEEAIELLATFRQQHADNEHYEDADLLYTLAKRNLIPRARQEAQEILRRHASESFSADADKFYFHVTGLRDPVLKEGNNVYADEPVLVILYERMGDPSHRDLQMLRKVEERWIPGEKRFLRKIAHTRIGDY